MAKKKKIEIDEEIEEGGEEATIEKDEAEEIEESVKELVEEAKEEIEEKADEEKEHGIDVSASIDKLYEIVNKIEERMDTMQADLLSIQSAEVARKEAIQESTAEKQDPIISNSAEGEEEVTDFETAIQSNVVVPMRGSINKIRRSVAGLF